MTDTKYYVVFVGVDTIVINAYEDGTAVTTERTIVREMSYIDFMSMLFPDDEFRNKEPETFFQNKVLDNFSEFKDNYPNVVFNSVTLVKASRDELGNFHTQDVCTIRPNIISKFRQKLEHEVNLNLSTSWSYS